MPTISELSDKIPITYVPTEEQKYRAARSCAHHATDAGELAQLLDMLGLTAADGLAREVAA